MNDVADKNINLAQDFDFLVSDAFSKCRISYLNKNIGNVKQC